MTGPSLVGCGGRTAGSLGADRLRGQVVHVNWQVITVLLDRRDGYHHNATRQDRFIHLFPGHLRVQMFRHPAYLLSQLCAGCYSDYACT